MQAERLEDSRIRWCTAAMAGLATAALELAVREPDESPAAALVKTSLFYLVPTLTATWYFGKSARSSFGRKVTARPSVLIGLVALFSLPFCGEGVQLAVGGSARMPELVLLSALRNMGLGLAVVSCRRFYARLSALVSLFLVIVAAPMGGETSAAATAPVVGFAIAGTFWLMLVYWNRLAPDDAARAQSSRLPLVGFAWVLGIVAILGGVLAVGPSRAATTLAELMPTSGGTNWSDPDARSGVGDGDNEVSASENPQSVGFTESEVYLETDRPSLYDAFNDSYGEPFKPKKQEKMIALGQQDVGEQKERPSENLQAGREFSAVRRKPETRPNKPGERAAKALVYVKGPTPLHLALTAYDRFDGTTWSEEPQCSRDLAAEREPGGSRLRLPWAPASLSGGVVSRQIKIGTLDSSPMPLPSHVTRFKVGSVDRPDFFGWAQYGIIRMTDRTVPAGTVIDCESMSLDPGKLKSTPFAAQAGTTSDAHVSFHGTYSVNPAVVDLARSCVKGVAEGWPSVEAVIARLRRDYVHDRSAPASSDESDVVSEFLLRSKRGPDYLFASSAAVLLRSLGYPTRVVSGLYASPARYDARTRHTPVTREDVHFWAEVRLPSGLWITVEPTPGYNLAPAVLSWTAWAREFLLAARSWLARHAAAVASICLLFILIAARRRELIDGAALFFYRFMPCRERRDRVLGALRLVERRARWAGCARPPGATPRRWYQDIAKRCEDASGESLRDLVRLADWAGHAPGCPNVFGGEESSRIDEACLAAIRDWTVPRFREAAPRLQSRRKGVTT